MSRFWFRRVYGIVGGVLLAVLAVEILMAQQPPQRFGGAYSDLDTRRQQLVGDWVARFAKVTGQSLDARSFYDDVLRLSTKTTFDAVTHALLTTPLTDASGQKFGDGLSLIERVDTVKGEVSGTPVMCPDVRSAYGRCLIHLVTGEHGHRCRRRVTELG